MSSFLKDGELDKTNFIEQLSAMSPQELNELIRREGKPPKPYEPLYFYRNPYKFDKNGGIINGNQAEQE